MSLIYSKAFPCEIPKGDIDTNFDLYFRENNYPLSISNSQMKRSLLVLDSKVQKSVKNLTLMRNCKGKQKFIHRHHNTPTLILKNIPYNNQISSHFIKNANSKPKIINFLKNNNTNIEILLSSPSKCSCGQSKLYPSCKTVEKWIQIMNQKKCFKYNYDEFSKIYFV